MLIIGLTGGIGSGKSAACKIFTDLGVTVIDADRIAHELVAAGQPALEHIKREFGTKILTAHGELDRTHIKKLIFSYPERRKILESILHPLIREEMLHRAGQINAPYCILCIPLLVETGQFDLIDRVLLIDAPETLQVERIQQRDALTVDEIQSIIKAQATRDQRLAAADDVIINDNGIDKLEQQIKILHRKYLMLGSDN